MKQIILDLTQKKISLEITEDSEILGIFVGKNHDEIDTHLEIIHSLPRLKSRTLIKAVLFDHSKFDIDCNLIINHGAKETDGYFKIDSLNMSSDASAKIIPSLEIMEDDVKGGHGATVGKVNRDQLNYLMSRGLAKAEAEQVIVTGFITDLIQTIQDETIKAKYINLIENA